MASDLKRQVHNIGRRRAWAIWGAGVAVYALAVFHRTSLGVAGILAAERFHINASQLSTFTVVQLTVYAAMQIPVGVLLDRYGAKALMVTGLALMTVAQLWFAYAGTFPAGLAARVLLGMGDAMIFTALLRLVALWFRVKQAPLVTQITGAVGQLGAVAAASPLAAALHAWGWTTAFSAAAGLGIVLAVPLVLVVRNSPYAGSSVERVKLRALALSIRDIWGNPGTHLGLWSHFTLQFSPTIFGLLWGYPFLVVGQGLSPSTAATLLMVMTISAMVAGPVVARIVSEVPYHRSTMVLVIVAIIASTWAVVLLWPGRAPLPVLVMLVVLIAIGGPASMVGFDLARSFHQPERLGRASGVVNVGGFVASLLSIALIGVVLDLRAPNGPTTYTTTDFKVALAVQYLFWGFGAAMVWRYRRRARDLIAEVPGAMEALLGGSAILPGLSSAPLEPDAPADGPPAAPTTNPPTRPPLPRRGR